MFVVKASVSCLEELAEKGKLEKIERKEIEYMIKDKAKYVDATSVDACTRPNSKKLLNTRYIHSLCLCLVEF